MSTDRLTRARERGVSALEILIVAAIAGVLMAITFVGVSQARRNSRRINATRDFQNYLELARADAVRRHDSATVQVVDARTYRVVMDHNNDGTLDADGDGETDAADVRTFTLPDDLRFSLPPPVPATFDWRGRVAGNINFTIRSVDGEGRALEGADASTIALTAAGDITVNSEVGEQLPEVEATPFPGGESPTPPPTPSPTPMPGATPPLGPSPSPSPSPSVSPSPSPSPSPSVSPSPSASPTPTGTPNASPTPTPRPSPSPSPDPASGGDGCSIAASPSSVTVRKKGLTTGTFSASVQGSASSVKITASPDSGLSVSPASVNVGPGGSGTFSVASTGNNAGRSLYVNLASTCGMTKVAVMVKN